MAKKTFKMIKTIYFDERSARDYIDVVNGGRFDWSAAEDKERIAKIIAELRVLILKCVNVEKRHNRSAIISNILVIKRLC